MAKKSSVKLLPIDTVTLSEVIDDKALQDIIRKMMEPAIQTMVWRTAMVAKQFALVGLEEQKRRAALSANGEAALAPGADKVQSNGEAENDISKG